MSVFGFRVSGIRGDGMITLVLACAAPRGVAHARVECSNGRVTIDDLLAEARRDLVRLTPAEALAAHHRGAVIVDIRPEASRLSEGGLPGAVVVERTVLEWRLDPASEARLPWASYDVHLVVVCNEGYSSSLAAATLRRLGVHRATDLVGGFRAWKAAGLLVS